MIHKITENVPKTTDYYVAPCINCNCDNISIDEYEDQIGYITTLKCTHCKNEIKINLVSQQELADKIAQQKLNVSKYQQKLKNIEAL